MKISTKSVRVKLDRIDKNIIRHLQANGRIQNNDLARELDDLVTRMLENPYPIIVSVPSDKGESGYAMEKMKEQMERALGVDVLFSGGNR